MKIVRMSLISCDGRIINEYSVPYPRRKDALDHAMDRADQEGHAGVLWATCNDGVIQYFAFDSYDLNMIVKFSQIAADIINNMNFKQNPGVQTKPRSGARR
ncbi:hypothetical protein ABE504_25180 [Paenibacillus oryzisoli]|uniref:hypothetical protein n=1 Tax=Paenibacillus oryzisoli TaxID=1850517 RepID=UPI003D275BB3